MSIFMYKSTLVDSTLENKYPFCTAEDLPLLNYVTNAIPASSKELELSACFAGKGNGCLEAD